MSKAKVLAVALLGLQVSTAAGQATAAPLEDDRFAPLITIGSLKESRLRDAHLLGTQPAEGFLLRSPSALSPTPGGGSLRWRLITPRLDAIWNSEIPFSLNDGTMWAGRGLSLIGQLGLRADWGALMVVVAPEFAYMQNSDTPVLPPDTAFPTDRSDFASTWHSGAYGTADLPIRFGNEPIALFGPGQSTVALSLGGFAFGATTENEWWGPALRNSIVLSNHAPGFPRAFLSTRAPIHTRAGSVRARWIAGVLTESLFFDGRPENDHRSISAFALALQPAFDSGLTLGFARSVIAPLSSRRDAFEHALDVFTDAWTAQTPDLIDTPDDLGTDQLLSVFGRWVLPGDGVEVYGEWAWAEVPQGVRELLTMPNHARGFTAGLQFLGGSPSEPGFRLQVEATSLERSPTGRERPSPTFYLGRSTEHGYTNRGQVIGAAVGPGGSSQWLAIDHFLQGGSLSVGLAAGRIRWENDTFYSRELVTRYDHDVTLFAGPRFTAETQWGDIQADALVSHRYNYLFQRLQSDPVQPRPAIDVTNVSLRFSLVPT